MIDMPAAGLGSVEAAALEGPLRVLVIDRQPLFLAAISRLLACPPLNASVIGSNRWDEALAISQEPIDLVVCEARAGPVPGAQIAGILAARRPAVRVILLADPGDESLLVASLLSGASGFFTKDVAVDEFIDGVATALKGHYAVGRNLIREAVTQLGGQRQAGGGDPLSRLSAAERSILIRIGQAQSVRTIAEERGISQKTVRNHLANIYRKLQLRNRTQAILWTLRAGLTQPGTAG
jgi:DNA-binding NarL/FixJ family response regulator